MNTRLILRGLILVISIFIIYHIFFTHTEGFTEEESKKIEITPKPDFNGPTIVSNVVPESIPIVPSPTTITPNVMVSVKQETKPILEQPESKVFEREVITDDIKKYIMTGSGFIEPTFDPFEKLPIKVPPPDSYLLDDGASGTMGLHTNLCSKSCCSEQYPLPFKMRHEPSVCKNKNNFVPSNLMCNNAWQDVGCLCLTKDQASFLATRGGNSY